MTDSYKEIDYRIRPAKAVERKMLCDAFRRLSRLDKIENYRYIGLGSTNFMDFALFHKSLGISKMISIERNKMEQERFHRNRPFRCIEIHFDETTVVLPTLSWDEKSIIWLDYDDKLNKNILVDIDVIFANAIPGSMIAITVNSQPVLLLDEKGNKIDRLENLKEIVGNSKVPASVEKNDLRGWGVSGVCRKIINNEILEILNSRNGGVPHPQKIQFKQLFNFNYADGAKMLTFGGLLYTEEQENLLRECSFSDLPFIREGEVPYLIDIPILTLKEIRKLDQQLPRVADEKLELPAVPPSDIAKYEKIYRFFPTFTEADI